MSEPRVELEIDRRALEQLAALLLERAGLKITPDAFYGLRLALQARMPALGLSDAAEYVRRLKHVAGEHELRSLLPLVTVGKTEFFRDQRQFHALTHVVIPSLLRHARRSHGKVRIWSAGCATGEEPYSVAMVALEQGALESEIDIWATDLNPLAVEAAARGIFPARRMVGVSEERLAKYFTQQPDGAFQANALLKRLIRFEGHNLAAPVFPQIERGSLDLILCRNVIIYFDQPTIRGLIDRFYGSLRHGGIMLLGYSETLFRMETGFEMFEVNGSFSYRKPMPVAAPVGPEAAKLGPVPQLPMPPRPSGPTPAGGSTPVRATNPQGVAAVTRPSQTLPMVPAPSSPTRASSPMLVPPPSAGQRISSANTPALGAPVVPQERRATGSFAAIPTPMPSVPARPVRSPINRLQDVISLVEKGDFVHALLAAHQLAADHPDDLAALLTLGNIHALMGAPEKAREVFEQALVREPLCVEARVYSAISALQAGALDEAKTELTRALFLEPNLVLGHYLLGQVLERKNDSEGARRCYRNAIAQRKAQQHPMLGHFPELPRTNEAVAQAAQYRLAALSEQ